MNFWVFPAQAMALFAGAFDAFLRARGAEEAEKIRAEADRTAQITIADAYRKAFAVYVPMAAQHPNLAPDSPNRDQQMRVSASASWLAERMQDVPVLLIGCLTGRLDQQPLAMQAAAEARIPFYVLDRPNPLGGLYVSGFMLESAHRSFVGQVAVPVVHGLTVGELARLIKGRGLISVCTGGGMGVAAILERMA